MAFTSILGVSAATLGNILLGMEPVAGSPLNQTVTDTLALTQSVTAEGDVPESISQSLAFTSTASNTVDRSASVGQSLAFSQTAVPHGMQEEHVADTLAFTQTASYVNDVPVSVSDYLVFTDNFTANIKMVSVSQSLGLTDSAAAHGPLYLSVQHYLNLTDSETGHAGTVNKTVLDSLVLIDVAGLTYSVSVSQSLALTDSGARTNIITDSLAFSDSATAGKGGDVSDMLSFTETITTASLFSRSVSQTLGVNQSVTYYVESACIKKQYSPYVGSTTDPNYTAPSTTPPVLGTHTLTLTYPYTSPTTTLVLRNPAFGDRDRLTFTRINRLTRGGTLIVFSDPKWPKLQTLVLQVDNLSQKQVADLLSFLSQSLGKEIGLLDWENRQWRGIITKPDAQVTHVSKNNRSVAFEFQGTLA